MNATRAAIALVIAAMIVSSAATRSGASEDVAAFYKGKTISAIIGYPPGGGYDIYMRTLARHIGRHIPGSPIVLPRNMPGAGSLVAANNVYNTAAKDGTAIGIFASSTLFSVKLGETKGNFEIDKFTWIGNMDQTIGTCVVHKRANITSFQDLFARNAIFGASGPSAVNSIHVRGFNALLGTRIQIVNGYPGSTDVLLAMSRGEADGGCGFALSSLKTTRRQDWESGEIRAIIQTGFEKSDELKNVPHVYDYAKTEDDKKVMHLLYGTHALGRPISAPPGVSADRVKALRDAFNATMRDPMFLAEAGKQDMPIDPWTGDQTERVIVQFTSYPFAIYDRARRVLEAAEAK
jgi:tripartite-type tricarboxylate transporter receptor subunit TctC